MKITLEALTLENFKGVRSFTLDAQNGNVAVRGDNATGKTTLFDAFTWLLFGKDSRNRADFDIKTLTAAGEPRHNLEHAVEATLQLDGRALTLRRVYAEKWTRKRGSADAEFTGHTTTYSIDGVPVQKKEYDQRVAGIVDEGVFRLLTDPAHFNEVMKWQDRRALLLDITGDVTDEDVIAGNPSLKDLPGVLGNRTIEEHRKVIAARRAEINKELERLPVRIDEATRGMPDLPTRSRDDLQAAMTDAKAERDDLSDARARIEAGGEIAEKRKRVREIETELHDLARAATKDADAAIEALRDRRNAARDASDRAARELARLHAAREDATANLQRDEAELQRLRDTWARTNAERHEGHTEDTCPVCHQALPADQVQAAHDEALAQFNARKSERLTAIQRDAETVKARIEKTQGALADLEAGITDAENEAREARENLDRVTAELETAASEKPDPTADPRHAALTKERADTEAAIEALRAGNADALTENRDRIQAIDERLRYIQADLNAYDARDRAEARIADLTQQEKTLAREYEDLERQTHLTEEFTRSKVGMLEEKINARFELANFRLFDTQINGGLAETCTTTYQGVPYDSLNHGARINVGLDIVRTLQHHFGAHPPVWIDQAEAVTRIIDMPCQTITLTVSATDKQLRVEAQREEVAA